MTIKNPKAREDYERFSIDIKCPYCKKLLYYEMCLAKQEIVSEEKMNDDQYQKFLKEIGVK